MSKVISYYLLFAISSLLLLSVNLIENSWAQVILKQIPDFDTESKGPVQDSDFTGGVRWAESDDYRFKDENYGIIGDIFEDEDKEEDHSYSESTTAMEGANDNSVKESNSNNEKIAVITFDDGWKSQYENAKPILDEYNFKATFYVVCDYIGNENRISWQQITNLQDEGHEIGSHTMGHENLDEIPTDQQRYQVVESKKCLEDNGIEVKSFAYPFNSGDDNANVLDLVSRNYDFARTAGGADSNNNGYQEYTIVGWSHDADRKKYGYSDSEMLNAFKEYVNEFSNKNPDDASSEKFNNIPILIYHRVGDDGEDYSTSVDLFKAEMEYLYENGFKVVAMDDVFES